MGMNDQWERLKEAIKLRPDSLLFIERDVNDVIKLYDPNTLNNFNLILQQCWRICEKITKYLFYNERLEKELSRNLFENIEYLQREKIITAEIACCFHLIRIYTNKTKHGESFINICADDLFIIIEALIKILAWFGDNFTSPAQKVFSHRPIVIMADIPELYTRKLMRHIYKSINRDIIYINEGQDILSFDLKCENIVALVLLITDVTKLSENDSIRAEINERITNYVENGGFLVITSDVIFRRTRNEGIQKLLGCVIEDYKRYGEEHPIKYSKTSICRNMEFFKDLPDNFELSDGVVNWGKWEEGCEVLFETDEECFKDCRHPLVVLRRRGKGVCFWLNGGEYRDHPPKSLSLPEKPLIELIKAFIQFVSKI